MTYEEIEQLVVDIKNGRIDTNNILQALDDYSWLTWTQPISDYCDTHIISDKAVINAMPLLCKYYEQIPEDDWRSLKQIMFADKEMDIPKRYPSNTCNLRLLIKVMKFRLFETSRTQPKPKMTYYHEGVNHYTIDFGDNLFYEEDKLLDDLITLSNIWGNLWWIDSPKLFEKQLEIAEWIAGKRMTCDFMGFMDWLCDSKDVFDSTKELEWWCK